MRLIFLLAAALLLAQRNTPELAISWDVHSHVIAVPMLERPPVIDGDLSDWRDRAFHDGVWDIYRVMRSPWYDHGRNRLTDHGSEPSPEDDLAARYYVAWDRTSLYLGADVRDNVNDTDDPTHEPKRWYGKDAVCWFIEAPRDTSEEKFGRGDNAFCFVVDPRKPTYGAWWRHGTESKTYVEEPLPDASVSYVVRRKGMGGDFVLEARVNMASTFGVSDPSWQPPKIGDEYGFEIVHTDPDGGGYGGHLMIYGTGDTDSTWGLMRLTAPILPLKRARE